MYEVPPGVVKTWPEPNYDNPETRGPSLIILVSLFFLIAAFVVLVRCYTRWYITKSFGADDVFIMVAMVPTTCLAISVLIANIHYGCDRHIWDMRPEKFKPCIKVALGCSVLFAFASLLTKLSLYAFYLRLLTPEGSRLYRSFVWLLGSLCVVCAFSYTFQICFLCKPVHAFWDYAPPLYRPPYEYHCADRFAINFYGSIVNVVIDLITMLAPAPIALRLALPLRQRLGVICIFGLGIVVCVAGALKTKFIIDSEKYSYDEQWDGYPLWIVMTVEIDIGIICASAPALRPFIARYLPRVFNLSCGRSSDSLKNNLQPCQLRPFLFPHDSPVVRIPSAISQDYGLFNSGDNSIFLSSSLSAPKTNRYPLSSSSDSRLSSQQREESPLHFKGEVATSDLKHGLVFPSRSREYVRKPSRIREPISTHQYQSRNQPSSFTDIFHATTTIITITARASLDSKADTNIYILRTAKSRIGEELENQRGPVIQRVDRRTKPSDSDLEQGDSLRGWNTS